MEQSTFPTLYAQRQVSVPSAEEVRAGRPRHSVANPVPLPSKLRFHQQTETCTKLRADALAKLRFHPKMNTCVDL